jgi:putative SOS response-associated peptidase YedK
MAQRVHFDRLDGLWRGKVLRLGGEPLHRGRSPCSLHRCFTILPRMCGRYGYVGSEESLREDFPSLSIVDPPVTGYNLSPGRKLSVVMDRGSGPELRALLWGLRTEKIKHPLVNVRAERISEHRLFAPLFQSHRCLVPATTFVEWLDDSEPRQPFVAKPKRGRFGLAAVELQGTFGILTRQATGSLARVHGRMPVVLGVESFHAWLDPRLGDPERLRAEIKSFSVSDLEVYPVELAINDARLDGPALVVPARASNLRDRERVENH